MAWVMHPSQRLICHVCLGFGSCLLVYVHGCVWILNNIMFYYIMFYIYKSMFSIVWMYYKCNPDILHRPCCHYQVPTRVSFIASLPFTNPLQWLHGIVKCPSYSHFRISPEVHSKIPRVKSTLLREHMVPLYIVLK